MLEAIPVDAAYFFEFIGSSKLAVILVSIHPRHTFNRTLGQQLGSEYPDIALGSIGLADVLRRGPVLRLLHQGLLRCGAPSSFGVLPGYYLFQGGQMLAWDAGLPSFADAEAIGKSALLGVIWSGVTRNLGFVGQALRLAAEQVAAQRVATEFRHAVASAGAHGRRSAEPSPPPADDLYWAYQTLGVPPTATDRQVHEAWRRRRTEAHPDHAAQDPAEFERRSRIAAEINHARDIIGNHRSGGARHTT